MRIVLMAIVMSLSFGCSRILDLGSGINVDDMKDNSDIYGCIKGPPPGGLILILVVPKGTKIPLERIPVC